MEPIIKVRYKEKQQLLLFLLLLLLQGADSNGALARCDKTPGDQGGEKIPGNNGFAVSVSGSPRKYRPNQVYTISVKGIREEQIVKFQGFLLVAEPALGNNLAMQGHTSLGIFQLTPGDAMTKFSHTCDHATEATSSISKEFIQVYWTSPARGSGCIDFKAMVVERQDVWYMDDGALTYQMCEDDSPLAEPAVVEPCCACDEAKYEVIFEGIWSRHTHPKDFPRDEWRTKFSKLIGASHSRNYSLWEYGRPASPALQVLGEHGVTRTLEREMKRFSRSIRSVVKAHGLQQRSNVAGQTFAVFRVDPVHHLLSIVSKMIPSPDWIVGLSKENLCLTNCSWVDSRVIDLYPWDIGTDSRLRYDGQPSPQRPKGVAQRITSSNPHSSDSPFYDPTGAPMKPAARLHLIKQREYIKTCPEGRPRPGSMPSGPVNLNPSWTNPMQGNTNYGNDPYSTGGTDTSYYYGTGIGEKLNPGETSYDDPYAMNNQEVSTSYGSSAGSTDYPDYNIGGGGGSGSGSIGSNNNNQQGGYGTYGSGNTNAGQGPVTSYNDPCATTDWADWSECSSKCDSGSHNRKRDYVDRATAEMNNCNSDLFEKKTCAFLPKCPTTSYAGSFNPFEMDQQLSGISTPWLERGLQSGELTLVSRLKAPNSYTYNSQPPGRYGNNQPSSNSGYSPYQARGTMQDYQPNFSNDPPLASPYGNSYTYAGPSSTQTEAPRSAKLNAPVNSNTSTPKCEVSLWGDWSDCSSKCDSGSRTRTRRYLQPQYSSSCTLDLYEVQPCRGNEPDCPPRRQPNGTPNYVPPSTTGMRFGNYGGNNNNRRFEEGNPMACDTSDWSDWSPCSKKCGKGFMRRTRLYLIPFVPNRSCDVRLYDKDSCYGSDSSCSGYYGDPAYSYDDYNNDDAYEKSTNVVIQSLVEKNGGLQQSSTIVNNSNPAPGSNAICTADPDPGSCHGHAQRWYFDPITESCKTFSFTGCYGNQNNFASKHNCEATCANSQKAAAAAVNNHQTNGNVRNWPHRDNTANAEEREDNWRQIKALNQIRETTTEEPLVGLRVRRPSYTARYMELKPLSCQVSAWSAWTTCSKSCGIGWQTRQREVLVTPASGGRSCPRKMTRRKKCRPMPCPANTKYWYQGSWRHMTSPEE